MNQPKVVLALRLIKILQNNTNATIDDIAAQLGVQSLRSQKPCNILIFNNFKELYLVFSGQLCF